MKISSIPAIYRNVNRATEVLTVLSRYGLAEGLSRLNLEFAKGLFRDRNGSALARQSREVRIRLALSELGPTFIKLGQLLSTRPEMIGQRLAAELSLLRDSAPADPPEVVRKTVELELGQDVDSLFRDFENIPIASASIGQVHRAALPSGERVVVKVQREGIGEIVRKDLDVMAGLAQLAERIPELAPYRPVATLAEMQRTLRRELDFGREERNLQQFAMRFQNNVSLHIPRPYSDLCTPRVLTMEYLEGHRLDDLELLRGTGFDLAEIARKGAESYLQMIFVDGFYHADPHPGNFVLMPGNVIGLLDFGMVGRLDEELREQIEDMLGAIVQRDSELLAELIARVGQVSHGMDLSAFRNDLADFVSHYANQALYEFDLRHALTEMMEMIYRYKISLPAQASLLIKTLVTLEGTAKLLHPQFSIMEIIQPFQRRAFIRRLSPARRLKKMRRAALEMEHLVTILPRKVMQLLEQAQSGEVNIRLEHRRFGPAVNRLVLGLLASALFLGSSVMLSLKVPPLLFHGGGWWGLRDLSFLGLAGCTLSCLLSLRLLWAIGKSGHLDRRE
jgi:ubiquinone biosynthesis protein